MSTFNTFRDAALEYIRIEETDATVRKKKKAFQNYENCLRLYLDRTLKDKIEIIQKKLMEELRKEYRGY